MGAMTAGPHPAEYLLARRVLLDALDALGPHRDAVVLVGAQAVYLHTGDGDLAVAPTTTDADIVLSPDRLRDEPLLDEALRGAGFVPGVDPGMWRGAGGVALDLMVPEALSGSRGRRGARLPVHGSRVARRTTGLEPALVDNEARDITSFDDTDARHHVIRVAGPAALLVAKVIKIEDRSGQPDRRRPKDGLDVFRLLQTSETHPLATRLAELAGDPLAGDVTRSAMTSLASHGRQPDGPLGSLAALAVGGLADPVTVTASLVALVEDLLTDYEGLMGR